MMKILHTTHVDECKLLFPYFHRILYHPAWLESRVIVVTAFLPLKSIFDTV
jgi:hypothetical protein